jgi:hypothetical protein
MRCQFLHVMVSEHSNYMYCLNAIINDHMLLLLSTLAVICKTAVVPAFTAQKQRYSLSEPLPRLCSLFLISFHVTLHLKWCFYFLLLYFYRRIPFHPMRKT